MKEKSGMRGNMIGVFIDFIENITLFINSTLDKPKNKFEKFVGYRDFYSDYDSLFNDYLKNNNLEKNENSICSFLEFKVSKFLNSYVYTKGYPLFYILPSKYTDCGDFILFLLKRIYPTFKNESQIHDFISYYLSSNTNGNYISSINAKILTNKEAKIGDIIIYNDSKNRLDEDYHLGIYIGNNFIISKYNGDFLYYQHINSIPPNFCKNIRFLRINDENYDKVIRKYISFFLSLNLLEKEIDNLSKNNPDSISKFVKKSYLLMYKIKIEKKNIIDIKLELK